MTDDIHVHVDLPVGNEPNRFSASPEPQELKNILSDADLAAIREHFDQELADQTLMAGFGMQFKASQPYVDGLKQVIQNPSAELPLSRAQQEIVIIAMLTSQRLPMELGLHIYLGIANGHSPEMIGDIMMLVGIYGGVSSFAEGLFTAEKTLATLKEAIESNSPLDAKSLIGTLEKAFQG